MDAIYRHSECSRYMLAMERLVAEPRTWLVTGVAGFIGSNLLEQLLRLGQRVTGLDNFSTGHRHNIDQAVDNVTGGEGSLCFIEGDIGDLDTCRRACDGVDYVLHQAAIGSVPRSIRDPLTSHQANVNGFLNMLVAARDEGVRRFVYASSSSVYGDEPTLPKREDRSGRPLSPYAATKHMNEVYASVFQRVYGLETIGLRYFNVFGRRQDPNGEYAAVIPKWVATLMSGEPCRLYGDGETSRDFCHVDNAVQANILAATASDAAATDQIYNVACGERTTLNELYGMIQSALARRRPAIADLVPTYDAFRPGDIRHSLADIERIQQYLGYAPTRRIDDGLVEALEWYATAATGASGLYAGSSLPTAIATVAAD